MKMIRRVQEKYRKSNKFFLALKVLIGVVAAYFSFQVMFLSISGLLTPNSPTNVSDRLLFGMLFSLGLFIAVDVVEMLVSKRKEHFTLLLITAILILGGSAIMFLLESV